MARIRFPAGVLIVLALAIQGGCPIRIDNLLAEISTAINDSVDSLQTEDWEDLDVAGLEEQGDTVVINQNVTVITNVEEDLVVEELPDINLIGFENLTGFDIFVRYLADADEQGVLVYDGETLLLEYPCLGSIELLSEDDFDIYTGEFVQGFDIVGSLFLNPEDFLCGDAIILTFDPDGIVQNIELIDLY